MLGLCRCGESNPGPDDVVVELVRAFLDFGGGGSSTPQSVAGALHHLGLRPRNEPHRAASGLSSFVSMRYLREFYSSRSIRPRGADRIPATRSCRRERGFPEKASHLLFGRLLKRPDDQPLHASQLLVLQSIPVHPQSCFGSCVCCCTSRTVRPSAASALVVTCRIRTKRRRIPHG